MSGPWEDFSDETPPWEDSPPPPTTVPLSMKDFQQEIIKRIRAGENEEQIRTFAETVRDPDDPTGRVRRTIGPELAQAIEYYSQRPNVPVNVVDVTQGDPLGAALRGAADVATFNYADEIQAGLETGFGTLGDYDQRADELRAQRAIDAQTNPMERLAGQGVGTVSSMYAVPAKMFQGATALGTIGKSMVGGGVMGGASEMGAAQKDESLTEAFTRGAVPGVVLGGGLPVALGAIGAAGSAVNRIGSSALGTGQRAAESALNQAGLSSSELEKRAADWILFNPGKQPSLFQLLKPSESKRFTSFLSQSQKSADRVGETAARETRAVGKRIEERISKGALPPFAPPSETVLSSGARLPATGTEGQITLRAKELWNAELNPLKPIKLPFNPEDAGYIKTVILPEIGGALRPQTRKDMIEAINNGEMTVDMADTLRKKLRDIQDGATGVEKERFRQMAEDIKDLVGKQVPEYPAGLAKYGELAEASKGAKIGERAAFTTGANVNDIADDILLAGQRMRAGLKPGMRAGLIGRSQGRPRDVYDMASNLEENRALQAKLAELTSPEEAATYIEYAKQQRRGIDSIMAMAGIPQGRIPETLNDVRDIGKVIAANTLNVGGAFKWNVVDMLIERSDITGRGAERLADMLLDPRNRDIAIKAIGKKMGGKGKEVLYRAFLRTAAEIGKDNARLPEGYVTTDEEQRF
jgi:hypothetical protein